MILDTNDVANIELAIKQGNKIWENEVLEEFKRKLKNYYRGIRNECCYCKKNFLGEFNMVIDIEHILPKSKYNHLMFTIYNLNIACKRCNMTIKRERIDFIADQSLLDNNPEDAQHYKFIHPNFDVYDSHLKYYSLIDGDKKIIKYQVIANSSKGTFTYEYFKLSELEIDTINQAQGIKEKVLLSEQINPEIQKKIEDALKKL